ncbi:MAG TPA: hypothetical protein VGK48_20230 [Terriglobia bacterium]
MANKFQNRDALERLVLRYLLEHPTAADSIEGVRIWWLRGAGTVSQEMLRTVLDELLRRGWLVTRGETSETRIYGLNENEREAVERFAREPGEHFVG